MLYKATNNFRTSTLGTFTLYQDWLDLYWIPGLTQRKSATEIWGNEALTQARCFFAFASHTILSKINRMCHLHASPLLKDEKSTSFTRLISDATNSSCFLQQRQFLLAMKKLLYSWEQMICFQHIHSIQGTALKRLAISRNNCQHEPYLVTLRRTTSAWAEHQRKAVLSYRGTETTQDEEQRQLLGLQAETYRQQSPHTSYTTDSYLQVTNQETISHYLPNSVC